MLAYRTFRRVSLALRAVQTALLGASFVASDYAQRHGERAKAAGIAHLDSKIDAGFARVGRLFDAADLARSRAEEAADDWSLDADDHRVRIALIEREVL